MTDSQALTNLREMTHSFSDSVIKPVSKPENLVSNWACTSLYMKSSFLGRLWQCIHWLAGTSESSLRRTIIKTAKVANLTIQIELKKQKQELEQINAPGVLGSFWKSRSVSQMQINLAEAVRYRSLINTIEWANGGSPGSLSNGEEQNLEQALKKISTAVKLENQWKKFAANIPITFLYRELRSSYPTSQKELEKHRDLLQQTTCGEYPRETKWFGERPEYGKETKCPEALLYSPLVAVAQQLATNQELPREELTELFHGLMEQSSLPNEQILLDLATFLRNPTIMPIPSQLPSSVAKAVMNPNWVRRCHLEGTTDDSGILGCRRDWIKKQIVFHYPLFADDPLAHRYPFEHSYAPEEYMQKRHIRKFYCYEKKLDGSEAISVREFAEEVSG